MASDRFRLAGAPFMAMLLACGTSGDETPTATATPTVAEAYTVIADGIEGGVLLGAWSSGDILIAAGGRISGQGGGYLLEISDGAICTQPDVSDQALWWIHGRTPGDYYVVGEGGTILHIDESGREDESVDTDHTLYGVWDGGDRVWAVGGNPNIPAGQIWLKEDGVWRLFLEEENGAFFKVWCQDDDHCLFIGQNVAYFLEGDTLTEKPTGEHLLTCRGRAWDDIWCVGGTSTSSVLHWDGVDWNPVDTTGLGRPLMGVWTAPDAPIWVSGMNGFTAYQGDERWESTLPISYESFHAVWKHGDGVFFFGGNMLSAGAEYYGTVMRYGKGGGFGEVGVCEGG